jgi:hypothetical protein
MARGSVPATGITVMGMGGALLPPLATQPEHWDLPEPHSAASGSVPASGILCELVRLGSTKPQIGDPRVTGLPERSRARARRSEAQVIPVFTAGGPMGGAARSPHTHHSYPGRRNGAEPKARRSEAQVIPGIHAIARRSEAQVIPGIHVNYHSGASPPLVSRHLWCPATFGAPPPLVSRHPPLNHGQNHAK